MQAEDIAETLSEFLREYYLNEIINATQQAKKSIEIDFSLLEKFNIAVADYLLDSPDEAFELLREALKRIEPEAELRARVFNLPESRNIRIRALRAEHLGKLIAVDGIVKRASEIRPEVKEAIFSCPRCGNRIAVAQTERVIRSPVVCDCGNRNGFRLVEQKLFDARWVTIEEPYEIVSGEKPSEIMVYLKEDLTSPKMQTKTDPGNRIKVIGILRSLPRRIKGTRSRQMEIYLDANWVEALEIEWEELEITPEDEKKILELAKDPEIYQKLSTSLATSIYGHEEVKEALILQMFGGEEKLLEDRTRIRGEIHCLIIGDPATSKSQLMKLITTLVPRGKYVAGRSATAAGLIATVTRDEEFLGGWVLEAGAVIMANKSVCAIDEFEKLDKADQIALHECMEQGSYSYDTEILFSDGRKVKIGKFVNEIFEKYKDSIITGRNCYIVDLKNKEKIEILTTDFKKIFPREISNVSRHEAPPYFLQVFFQHGRTITVTPDHPFFVLRDDELKVIKASNLRIGDYVPIPTKLPLKEETQMFDIDYRKIISPKNVFHIKIPSHNSPKFLRFIGYFVSEGCLETNRGIKNGVNFTNTNDFLLNDFKNLAKKLFNIRSFYVQRRGNVQTLRIINRELANLLLSYFPELCRKAEEKELPNFVLKCKRKEIKELLKVLIETDGFITKSGKIFRIGYVTTSRKLAEQVQELLLKFGIFSIIYRDKMKLGKNVYRISITGKRNLNFFLERIGFLDERKSEKLRRHLESLKKEMSNIEVAPFVGTSLKNLCKVLKLPMKVVFGYTIGSKQTNLTRRKFREAIENITSYTKNLKELLKSLKISKTMKEIRKIKREIGISNSELASILNVCHQSISYWELKSKNPPTDKLKVAIKNVARKRLKYVLKEIAKLSRLVSEDILFIKVKKVRKKQNLNQRWVYDIQINPTRNFISNNLVLHNSVSVAKASIVATLPAKTAILAGGNPKLGRFDPYMPIREQVDIPETLLSRFDIKFALRDVPNVEQDQKMVEHIFNTRHFGGREIEPPIPPQFLRKYIAYARKNCHPKLSKEAAKALEQFYLELRKKSEEGPIAITPRQLEAMIRLAEASAKVRLSPEVALEDARRAINLMKFSLRQFGFEPETATFDIDRAEGQRLTALQRGKIRIIHDIIEELTLTVGKQIPVEEVIKKAREAGVDNPEEILKKMLNEGICFSPKPGIIEKIGGL